MNQQESSTQADANNAKTTNASSLASSSAASATSKPKTAAATSASSTAAAAAATAAHIESAESSDNDTTAEFSRLTDLLQSRGLPSHIVNAFGSKVQQFLHRTMSSGITGRSQQLIASLQQSDESIKLSALAELCQLLVMGNEDTLVGFPIKQAVPLLLQCINSESENFDLMNHACRALTYMMESLPRSSSIIADGIGIFLEKLQVCYYLKQPSFFPVYNMPVFKKIEFKIKDFGLNNTIFYWSTAIFCISNQIKPNDTIFIV
jgi:hypothetical protein